MKCEQHGLGSRSLCYTRFRVFGNDPGLDDYNSGRGRTKGLLAAGRVY